jgi:hypothetical protein
MWAMSLPGLIFGLVLLAALEKVAGWLAGRGLLPWRRDRGGTPAAAAGFDELGAVLSAGQAELNRHKQSTLIMPATHSDGAPPRSTVDLETGTARLVGGPKPDDQPTG